MRASKLYDDLDFKGRQDAMLALAGWFRSQRISPEDGFVIMGHLIGYLITRDPEWALDAKRRLMTMIDAEIISYDRRKKNR